MKKTILLSIMIFGAVIAYSQESKLYKHFSSQMDSSKTEYFDIKYKNGNIKEKKFLTTQYYNGYSQIFYSGKFIKYSKKGIVLEERDFDNFGSTLSLKIYDNEGYLRESYTAIDIDTNASDVEEFLFSKRAISFILEATFYERKDNSNVPVISKKGLIVNGTRSGDWTVYQNGIVKKTEKYKNIDKFKDMLRTRVR